MFFTAVANYNITFIKLMHQFIGVPPHRSKWNIAPRERDVEKIQYGHWCTVVSWLKSALSFTMSVSRTYTPVILVLQKKLTQLQSPACIQPWNILHGTEIHTLLDYPVKAKPQSPTATKRQTGREVCQHYPLTFFIKPHNLPAFSTLLCSLF